MSDPRTDAQAYIDSLTRIIHFDPVKRVIVDDPPVYDLSDMVYTYMDVGYIFLPADRNHWDNTIRSDA